LIGTEEIVNYCEKYRIKLDPYYDDKLIK